MVNLDILLQQILNGLVLGSVYALFALGFTLVFGVLGVINLSHGAVFMLGAYVALQSVTKLAFPLWAALATAFAGAFVGSLAELFSRRIDDNFSIPLTAAAAATVTLHLLGYSA